MEIRDLVDSAQIEIDANAPIRIRRSGTPRPQLAPSRTSATGLMTRPD
jgi:hypothetical protein